MTSPVLILLATGLLLAPPLRADPHPPATFGDVITVKEEARAERPGVVERPASGASSAVSPGASAAEAALCLPGVMVDGEWGEADRVLIRGAEARLVSTTLDGERLPSPDGERRSAGLSLIPALLLEEVAVAKTLSADRDADAVGGTVGLVTRRAPAGGLRTLELRGGAEEPSGGPLYGGSLLFGRRLREGRLGLLTAVTAEHAEREVGSLWTDFGDEEIGRSEIRDSALDRDHAGASVALDLVPSNRVAVELRGLYGAERSRELRRRVKDDVEEGLIERELKDGELRRELLSVALNGSRLSSSNLWESSIGYNAAAEREPDRVDTSFVQEEVEFATGARPTNEDPGLFVLDKIGVEENETRERNLFAAVDLTRQPRPASPLLFKTGAKVRDKLKSRDVQMTLFRPEEEVFLRDWAQPAAGDSRRGPMIGPEQARRLLAALGTTGQVGEVEETADYRAMEATAAAYAQAEVRRGRLTLLPGVRYEHTWSDYRGYELTTGETEGSALRPLRGEGSSGVLLPMLNAAFAWREDLQLHAALTRGFARPDYFDLVPYRRVDSEDLEIEEGNAGLRATRSWNLDARLDWRSHSGRFLGVGVFHRALTGFTFVRRGEVELLGETWDSTRPENGQGARLFGGEVMTGWRSARDSGPLAGWGAEASATWTRSEAWLAGRDVAPLLRLPGQSPWTGRLALSYERKGLTGVLAFHWADSHLVELGETRGEDLYRDGRRRLDATLSYTFPSGLEWRAEARNLTRDSLRLYTGSLGRLERPERTESYGRSFRSGFSLRF